MEFDSGCVLVQKYIACRRQFENREEREKNFRKILKYLKIKDLSQTDM